MRLELKILILILYSMPYYINTYIVYAVGGVNMCMNIYTARVTGVVLVYSIDVSTLLIHMMDGI